MSRAKLSKREAAVRIVRVLRDAGHVAYLAGGCVRDLLLGLEPKDYDVATDARPQQVCQHFKRSRLVGEAFGVVLATVGGQAIEVATFRTEWGYQDGRHPSSVTFSDAQHDAQRRDFTINGLFEDPLAASPDQRVIDYVGGRRDLEARLIRAIGDPDERFAEDYLRLLRAVRFAARLDFQIDPGTAEAIRAHAGQLVQISRERIGQEVLWMLTSPHAARAAELMQQLHLDGPTLDEEHAEPALATLRRLGYGAGLAAALAAWMLDRHVLAQPPFAQADAPPGEGDPAAAVGAIERFVRGPARQVVRTWRRALCLSNDHRDALAATIEAMPEALAWQNLSVAQRKRLLARPHWPATWALLRAMPADGPIAVMVAGNAAAVEAMASQCVAPPPLVTGDDLIAMGRKPGPQLGRTLDAVYDAQLEGAVTTRAEALAWVRQHE